jgi:ketosteroid isomerase-like protein
VKPETMKKIFLCILIVLLPGACQERQYNRRYLKAHMAAVTAIRSWLRNYTEAVNTADIERILSYQSDDVLYMPSNQPYFSGKESVRKWLTDYFDYCSPTESLNFLHLEYSGDFACFSGTYTISCRIKHNGEVFYDKGKFVNLFKHQPDGNWLITQSIWNSDSQTFDIHSQVPVDFSGSWELDLSKSTAIPDIISSSLKISQKVNDITINRTYEIKDKQPLTSSVQYTIGTETKSTSKTGLLVTTSFWSRDKRTFTVIETLNTEKSGSKQVFKRTTVYSLSAKGETLNIISDDLLPEGLLIPTMEKHMELIYMRREGQ